MTLCALCGLNLALVGRHHRCVPRAVANTQPRMANKVDVANKPAPDVANTYLYRDADKRREYMRQYMKRKRAG